MGFLIDMWMPILASAAAVWVLSAIMHMLLPFHKSDYVGLPGESEIAETFRSQNLTVGDYMFPHAEKMSDLAQPEMIEKFHAGPGRDHHHPPQRSSVHWQTIGAAVPLQLPDQYFRRLLCQLRGPENGHRRLPTHRHRRRTRLCRDFDSQLDLERPGMEDHGQVHARRSPLRTGHRSRLCRPGQLEWIVLPSRLFAAAAG